MKVARIQNEKSVSEVAARLYGTKPGDARAAAAQKALLAANPQLKDVSKLPAGTPVLVPDIPGVSAEGAPITDPKRAVWTSVLDKLLDSAQQGSNAQTAGRATPSEKVRDDPRRAALKQLEKDIAQFRKLHSS